RGLRPGEHLQDDLRLELRCESPPFAHPSAPPQGSQPPLCTGLNLGAHYKGHKIFPYLLRGVAIERADQVWSTDIAYVPITSGFMYLAVVID
ncbi:MAG: hypothetical protein JO252_01770, partial [Planctomycetaceae bacterium]|nr:hypothetical protein [Planctomycetaceae bacterium]MBV8313451.1 hypothetical protein [Planctomycetaceae bacterium]